MSLWELADLSTPWSIHVAATLRVAEQIAGGRTSIEELASACGADSASLLRVLRHLASRGVFEEPEPGRFALNGAARELLDPMWRLGLDLDGFGGRMAHAWNTLLSAVRSGKPAYQEAFGRSFWEDLDANPAIAAQFDELMGPAGHGLPDPEVLVDPGDWDRVSVVVDVGGGTGALLAQILKARPKVRGVLVDLPRTVARSSEVFEAAGVADRATAVGQSFFDPLPPAGDLYLLKSVLGDWADAEARQILERCAAAARPSGRVIAVNGVTPDDVPSPALLMMVLVGGKDRTLAEFRRLAAEAGLQVTAAGHTPSRRFVVECQCEIR